MKKFFLFIPLVLFGSVLSNLEEKKLSLEEKLLIKDAKITKNSWINPVILQYSITKDNITSSTAIKKLYSITLNQPIFKSGAIFYSIKYANDLSKLNKINLIIKKRELIKNALDLAYDYKITKLNEKILNLQIDNAKIDVKRKKEEYKNGTLDLTFLNNSIISLNNLKLSLEDIKLNLQNIKYNFQKISDLDIEKVNLKLFKILSLEKYLNSNIELKSKKISQKVNKDLYKMQIGDTLFTVFINGSLNYQKTHYSNAKLNDLKQHYYSIGIGISLPIDIKSKTKIEKAKINYLISKYDLLQKRRELINDYKNTISNIYTINKKISIYQENIKLYNELIKATKNNIKAGTSTVDDLIILSNSKEVNKLQIQILNLKIQKLLLNLYYKIENFSN